MRAIVLTPLGKVDGAVTADRRVHVKDLKRPNAQFVTGKPLLIGTASEISCGTACFVAVAYADEVNPGECFVAERQETLADNDLIYEVQAIEMPQDLITHLSFHHPL